MQNDIIKKLSNHLLSHRFSSEIWTDFSADMEMWIVYLLVQIRKLLDINKTDKYKILRLYCSWVIHVKIDNNRQASEIIKKTAEYLNNKPNDEAVGFLNFITLQKELDTFLVENGLSNEITLSKNGEWFEFRKILIQILRDQPLELQEKFLGNSDVARLVLVESKNAINGTEDYFINFEATLKSGEIIGWNILLGDYGGDRKVRIKKENKEFWKRYSAKLLFKQNRRKTMIGGNNKNYVQEK